MNLVNFKNNFYLFFVTFKLSSEPIFQMYFLFTLKPAAV